MKGIPILARNLITGFREKDPWLLSKIKDVPWQKYGLMWGKLSIKELLEQEESIAKSKRVAKGSSEAAERKRLSIQLKLARSFQREQESKEKKIGTNEAIRAKAGAGDWRTTATDDITSSNIEALKKKVFTKSKP